MDIERFKELLNLYLDDEISSAELSELISETRRDPERQELFLEYCRIHKACTLLRNELNSDLGSRRSVRQMVYAIGGLAAAFALLVMAGRNIVPLIEGGQDAVAVQPSEEATERLPEFAATQVLAVARKPQGNRLVLEPVGFSEEGRIHLNEVRSAGAQLRLRGQQLDFRNSVEELLRDGLSRMLSPGIGEMTEEGNVFEPAPTTDFSQNLQTVSHRFEFKVGPERALISE